MFFVDRRKEGKARPLKETRRFESFEPSSRRLSTKKKKEKMSRSRQRNYSKWSFDVEWCDPNLHNACYESRHFSIPSSCNKSSRAEKIFDSGLNSRPPLFTRKERERELTRHEEKILISTLSPSFLSLPILFTDRVTLNDRS